MRRKGVGKLYDRLTPEERFRLDVEAMARGDEEESRRLTETCPRRSYVMNDVGFAGRWDAARRLIMVALMDLGPRIAKLRMVAAFRTVLPYSGTLMQKEADLAYFDGHRSGSHHAWRAAGMEDELPGFQADEEEAGNNADPVMDADLERIEARVKESSEVIPRLLDKLERDLAEEPVAMWEAFSVFCNEEVGIEPEKLLKAIFEPVLENVRFLEELADRLGLQPEPTTVEEYRAALAEGWRRVVGRV
jgi:hypothetical protein